MERLREIIDIMEPVNLPPAFAEQCRPGLGQFKVEIPIDSIKAGKLRVCARSLVRSYDYNLLCSHFSFNSGLFIGKGL